MPNEFAQGMPIYLQITQTVRQNIASGRWPPGMRIPPVRELSVDMGVNPNTAQRSLAELEREGLVFTERTAGRFITKDTALISKVQTEMATEYAEEFYRQMRALGYATSDILHIIQRIAASEEE